VLRSGFFCSRHCSRRKLPATRFLRNVVVLQTSTDNSPKIGLFYTIQNRGQGYFVPKLTVHRSYSTCSLRSASVSTHRYAGSNWKVPSFETKINAGLQPLDLILKRKKTDCYCSAYLPVGAVVCPRYERVV